MRFARSRVVVHIYGGFEKGFCGVFSMAGGYGCEPRVLSFVTYIFCLFLLSFLKTSYSYS